MIEAARLGQIALFVELGKILRKCLDDRENGQQKGSSRREKKNYRATRASAKQPAALAGGLR